MGYKRYPKVRKQRALDLLQSTDFSVYRISKDLKIPTTTVQGWAKEIRKKPDVSQNTIAKLFRKR